MTTQELTSQETENDFTEMMKNHKMTKGRKWRKVLKNKKSNEKNQKHSEKIINNSQKIKKLQKMKNLTKMTHNFRKMTTDDENKTEINRTFQKWQKKKCSKKYQESLNR